MFLSGHVQDQECTECLGACQSTTLCTKLCMLPNISEAFPHTPTHCIVNPKDCVTLYCPHTCCLFVYLFVCLSLFLGITCCLPCLFISPFRLFPLLIGSSVGRILVQYPTCL